MRLGIVMLNSSGVLGVAENMLCLIECRFQSVLGLVFLIMHALRVSGVELLRSSGCRTQ